MFLERLMLSATLLGVASGCMSQSNGRPEADAGVSQDGGFGPEPSGIVASSKARLQFIGPDRYAMRLAQGLDLPRSEVCLELGLYDCASEVHTVALGGVEPYRLGVYVAAESTGSTTPIAVERMALAACTERADRDFADASSAVVFGGLVLQEGKLADSRGSEVGVVIDRLYRRFLQRAAAEPEIEAIRALYDEMEVAGGEDLARNWAAVGCFAVATSLEALFY